jgi:hypothetical protein
VKLHPDSRAVRAAWKYSGDTLYKKACAAAFAGLRSVVFAICALLVTASLVAVRGLLRSMHSNFGFEPQNATLADIDLSMAGYREDQVPAMQKRMLDAVEAIPGVESVGLVNPRRFSAVSRAICSSISSLNRSSWTRPATELTHRVKNRLRDLMTNPPLSLRRTGQ